MVDPALVGQSHIAADVAPVEGVPVAAGPADVQQLGGALDSVGGRCEAGHQHPGLAVGYDVAEIGFGDGPETLVEPISLVPVHQRVGIEPLDDGEIAPLGECQIMDPDRDAVALGASVFGREDDRDGMGARFRVTRWPDGNPERVGFIASQQDG